MRLTREQAQHYSEDDEDPGKVFAAFDAAEREGRLHLTAPHHGAPWAEKLREAIAEIVATAGRALEKAGKAMEHAAHRIDS
jgi:poly-gamma-glutamate capsule biosynthesis protein CapA/YwtB (metallophosphatase superfamily)